MSSTVPTIDCGTNMCPLCTSTPSFPCVGVPGAGNELQVGSPTPANTDSIWKYGNSTYVPLLINDSTANSGSCVSAGGSGTGLGLYARTGECVDQSKGMNLGLTQKNPLIIDSNNFQSLINADVTVDKFPLQGVHKVWGDGGGTYNKGVNSKNVYVSSNPENVNFTVGNTEYTKLQPVLVMEAHGDLYSGTVPGLYDKKPKLTPNCFSPTNTDAQKIYPATFDGTNNTCNGTDTLLPTCPNWTEHDSTFPAYNKRVGGVACTRDIYGPGVYNLLCYIPKTEDVSSQGRGYVFAIWPFHYEEHYKGFQKVEDTTIPCFNECDGTIPVAPTCPASKGCCPVDTVFSTTTSLCDYTPQTTPPTKSVKPSLTDYFSAINHEIDIEIPCNSPQLDWATQMTWSTMNCNTWLSDINNYDENTGAYYTQVAVQHPDPNVIFISTQAESSNQKDYHWYTMDWFVDPSDSTKNYVAFYFDDPFDPSGITTIGDNNIALPLTSSNKPLFKTQRFVPTRSGRLNFGPWMAWWGYGGKDNKTPNFDTAKVRLAQLSIIPYKDKLWTSDGKYLLTDFPQSYDQPGAICDFKDLVQPPAPSPTTTSTTKGFPLWAIIIIILGIIVLGLIIYAIVDAVKRKKKAKLLSTPINK